ATNVQANVPIQSADGGSTGHNDTSAESGDVSGSGNAHTGSTESGDAGSGASTANAGSGALSGGNESGDASNSADSDAGALLGRVDPEAGNAGSPKAGHGG